MENLPLCNIILGTAEDLNYFNVCYDLSSRIECHSRILHWLFIISYYKTIAYSKERFYDTGQYSYQWSIQFSDCSYNTLSIKFTKVSLILTSP